ncbi:MAG: polymer-forming cytoskeletal protein [Defluviitaleaceae bacterium]|nr:polymer-forming cytoskeletal protein [Defluviitaleaceae bacterium]
MFFFKKPAAVSDLDSPTTIIGEGVYLEAARMKGHESVRIDGVFKGNLEVDGSLVLGDCGSITGDVRATYFLAAGEVNGNIACETQLHFASTCKVVGDVQANSLVVDEGAQVSGRYIVRGNKTAAALSDHEPLKLLENVEANE